MKDLNTLLLLLFLMILSTSNCIAQNSDYYGYKTYYAPNEGTYLALNEKNDLKISAALGDGTFAYKSTSLAGYIRELKTGNYSLLIGYSPIKHLGVQSSIFRKGKYTHGKEYGKGYLANIAIGGYYFFPLKKKDNRLKYLIPGKIKTGILLDFYAGYGYGAVHNSYSVFSSSHFNFNKTFVQFGFHWHGRNIGFDYSYKIGNLDYSNGTFKKYPLLSNHDKIGLSKILDLDPFNIREQSFKFHVGGKYIQYYAAATIIDDSSEILEADFIRSSFFIGIAIDLNDFFIKEEPTEKKFD